MESSQPPKLENADDDIFRRFGLDPDNWMPHPRGNIPVKFTGNVTDKTSMEITWGIRKGSHYPPETHAHGHVLTIKQGSGVISISGEEKKYAAGDVFDIAPNVPHGFIKVDETTIVHQK